MIGFYIRAAIAAVKTDRLDTVLAALGCAGACVGIRGEIWDLYCYSMRAAVRNRRWVIATAIVERACSCEVLTPEQQMALTEILRRGWTGGCAAGLELSILAIGGEQ